MATPLIIEFGMGTSLRRGDYTEAAKRAIKDALWHNSINLAEMFGKDKSDMHICAVVGVQKPEEVRTEELKALFPYGDPLIHVSKGGLDVPRPGNEPAGGNPTIIANVALKVSLKGID